MTAQVRAVIRKADIPSSKSRSNYQAEPSSCTQIAFVPKIVG